MHIVGIRRTLSKGQAPLSSRNVLPFCTCFLCLFQHKYGEQLQFRSSINTTIPCLRNYLQISTHIHHPNTCSLSRSPILPNSFSLVTFHKTKISCTIAKVLWDEDNHTCYYISWASPLSKSSIANMASFPRFSELPLEMQDLIWEFDCTLRALEYEASRRV